MRTPTARAKIRQERTVMYFIEAAYNIIQEEGIGAVTIRKAADLAGYTSATLYNYFDDIYHLIFLATITHLEPYHRKLPKYTKWCGNSVERFLSINECFCQYAFEEPEVFELLFFKHSDEKLERYTKQYYELFPEKVVDDASTPLSKFFNINDIHVRSRMQLNDCVAEGFMSAAHAEDFNDITLMVFKSVLEQVKLGLMGKEDATVKMIRYYCYLFHTFTLAEKQGELRQSLQGLREHSVEFAREAYVLTPPSEAQ